MGLTKAAILAADDRRLEPVEVPEWGGTVYLREMSGAEREGYLEALRKRTGPEGTLTRFRNLQAELLVQVLVDERGAPLFDADEVDALGGKSGAVLQRLFAHAAEMNGLNAEAEDEAGEG